MNPCSPPPWKIGNVEMKNRIVMCPMGGTSLFGWMEPNHFDKVAAEFFLNIAHNNVGLIIPGIALLRDPTGVTVKGKNGASQTLAADDVILVVGYTPAQAFAKGRHVHTGDRRRLQGGQSAHRNLAGLEGGRTAVIKPH